MYIVRQYRKFWAYHEVPPSLRKAIGRRRLSVNLQTDDQATAEIRATAHKVKWLAVIERARTGTDQGQAASFYREALKQAVELEALDYRDMLRRAVSPAEREKIESLISLRAVEKAIEIDHGMGADNTVVDPLAHQNFIVSDGTVDPGGREVGKHFLEIATGQLVKLTENLDEYLATLKNESKSVDMKKSTIRKFSVKFPYVADVQRKGVQEWVKAQAMNGSAPATIRRSLSELRGYWAYLQSIGAASENTNPFEKLLLAKAGKEAKADERRAFASSDVLKLLAAAQDDTSLVDLIQIAMWTGARIEEICALTVEKVYLKKGYIDIVDAKTSAGWRQVPIHSELAPTLRQLIKASDDGYLLSGLSVNKYGDRSNAIGKRFGHLKTALGFGPQHVFHSIRKTVATLLENAGVLEGIAADILGHEKQTITYGLYSGGASLDVKRAAIEKLSYGGKKKR